MSVWFLTFWLRYLCSWFIYGTLGPIILARVLLKLRMFCRASRNVGYENTFTFLVIKILQEFSFPAISNANYLELGFNGLQ